MPTNSNKNEQTTKAKRLVYQFEIRLLDVEPAVWRRIQIPGETLDRLHRHIQAAMGWMNSHPYEFVILEQTYADLHALDGPDRGTKDARYTQLHPLMNDANVGFQFRYDYDFGDLWQHEITFEAVFPAGANGQYPVCLGGAGACPPEDVGVPVGYHDLLSALRDRRHEEHESSRLWVGEEFSPERFDVNVATAAMRRGLTAMRLESAN
jgi:hypothetical protein